jgi:hypothetical protein
MKNKHVRNKNAKVRLYDKEDLKTFFKWINTDDVELGSYGKKKNSSVTNLK